jgi:hypothetical protein
MKFKSTKAFTGPLIAVCCFLFNACAEETPIVDVIVVPVDTVPVIDTALVDSSDTIPYVKIILATDTAIGEFLRIDISELGDFLVMKNRAGEEQRFYCGVLSNDNPLMLKEFSYRNREVEVYWKKGLRYVAPEDRYAAEDSVVTYHFHELSVTIGSSGNLDSLPIVLTTVREGDTIKFAAGTYELDAALQFWGVENLVIMGDGDVELVCTNKGDNVMTIINSQNVKVRNLKMRHADPPPGIFCTGNVIAVDGCRYIGIEDCELNGCGAIGVYAVITEKLTLKRNHIHNNSSYAVQADGIGVQAETDTLKNVRFVQNVIENNGHGLESGAGEDVLLDTVPEED